MSSLETEKYSFRQLRPVLLFIFSVALFVRLLYLREASESPYFAVPFLDELYHYQWAEKVAQGNLLSERVFFRAPLYAYLVGTKIALLGRDFLTTKLFQHIIGAITPVLIFILAFLLLGGDIAYRTTNNFPTQEKWERKKIPRTSQLFAAIISALIYSFYAPAIFFEGEMLDTFLSLFFYPLILIFTILARRFYWRNNYIFLVGLLIGFAAITRPNVLIFIPFVLIYFTYWLWKKEATKKILSLLPILILGLILPVLPVTVHNFVVGRCFVPISTYDGINFFIGNNLTADGFTAKTTRHYVASGEYRDSVELFAEREAALLLGYKPTARELRAYWWRRGVAEIKKSPQHFLQLLKKKFALFWNAYELKNNKSLYVVIEFSPWLSQLWRVFNFGTVIPLALVGLILALIYEKKRRAELLLAAGLILGFCLSVILFFVSSRHRLPVVSLLIPFAGYGVYFLISSVVESNWRRVLTFLILAFLFALAINTDWYRIREIYNPARDYWSVGNCLRERDRLIEAIQYYQKALQYDAVLTDAYNNLGETLFRLGRYDEAAKNFQQAIQLEPDYIKGYNNLGVYYEEIGDFARAKEMYEKAILIEPEYALAQINLAEVLYKLGERRRAIYHYLWAQRLGIERKSEELEALLKSRTE